MKPTGNPNERPPVADRNAHILQLWAEGKSVGEIVKLIGHQYGGLTRTQVSGICHRAKANASTGATPRAPTVKPPAPRRTTPKALAANLEHGQVGKAKVASTPGGGGPPIMGKPGQLPAWDEGREDTPLLEDLGTHQCQWPVGTTPGPQRFCGAAQDADPEYKGPYCRPHRLRARGRQPTGKRRQPHWMSPK